MLECAANVIRKIFAPNDLLRRAFCTAKSELGQPGSFCLPELHASLIVRSSNGFRTSGSDKRSNDSRGTTGLSGRIWPAIINSAFFGLGVCLIYILRRPMLEFMESALNGDRSITVHDFIARQHGNDAPPGLSTSGILAGPDQAQVDDHPLLFRNLYRGGDRQPQDDSHL